jgi:hypothetical protein
MSRGGIMLTVIKKVMPSQKWVAEPVLLSMMQAAGLPAATSEHFSAFYKTHPAARRPDDRSRPSGEGLRLHFRQQIAL